MTDFSSKTVCVCDHGLFVHVAQKLSESFGRTLYYRTWEEAFPKLAKLIPGDGLDGVERIQSIWPHLDDVDLFVFPDLFFGPLQEYLRSIGKRVWGAGKGEELEIYRGHFKTAIEKMGLPVGNYKRLTGVEALRKYLDKNERQWVKASLVRGDIETFFSENSELIEPMLDHLEDQLGASQHVVEFVVEEPLEDDNGTAVEIGYDGYTVNGGFASIGYHGFEIKDSFYLGCLRPYQELATPVLYVNEMMAPLFKKYGYRGPYHSEIRVLKDGIPYFTDITCRCASPPTQGLMEAYKNWPEIMWEGAEGNLVNPDPVCKYFAQAMVWSDWVETNWQPVYFPKKDAAHFKFENLCQIDGTLYVVPQPDPHTIIGAVCGFGDTIAHAVQQLRKHAKNLEGYQLEVKLGSLPKAIEQIENAADYGIEFTDDPLPTPEELE